MQPMVEESTVVTLCATAIAVGVGHTILGPDHYVPFAAMSRAGCWSVFRTLTVTAACGLVHVAGSVAIGLAGVATGAAITKIELLEGLRGDVAAWLLVGVGTVYAIWGILRAKWRVERGARIYAADVITVSAVSHCSHDRMVDGAAKNGEVQSTVWAPWALFLVFLFGPCEPLIPLLMYPAATLSPSAVVFVVVAFAAATVTTMVVAVLAISTGLGTVPVARVDRYGHALAGLAVAVCGVLVASGL